MFNIGQRVKSKYDLSLGTITAEDGDYARIVFWDDGESGWAHISDLSPLDEGCSARSLQPPMSLRDWFAGQALAGGGAFAKPEDAAEYAYRLADAMLAAREVSHDDPA